VAGEVLEVKERFVHYSGGHKAGRLVTYRDTATSEVSRCDEAYATAIIHRPKGRRRRKVNRFANMRNSCLVSHPRRGVIQGGLPELVSYVLGGLPLELDMPLCEERVNELYARQGRPGHIPGSGHGFNYRVNYRVRIKPFKSWVRRNASRLLETRAEVDARNSQLEREYADSYYRWVEELEVWEAEDSTLCCPEP
jgi:hypothetical protein